MAISNTNILIKRSSTSSSPSSLNPGELAYSYVSNTAFIGTADGLGVLKIGGESYTSAIDSATNLDTPLTIVERDSNGAFFGALYGNANSATKLLNAQNFSISGGDITASSVSFDGTSGVTLNASLNNISGLTAGEYGSSTAVPNITVAANGRITSISTSSITTSWNLYAGLGGSGGTSTIYGGDTLTIIGSNGITANVTAADQLTISTDNTVVRSNTAGLNQTIDGTLNISGNLNITGEITYANVNNLIVDTSLVYLANNNTSDAVDIGFVGQYSLGSGNLFSGVFRHAGDKQFYVFDSYNVDPLDYVINPSGNNFSIATLNTNITSPKANISVANVTTGNVTSDFGIGGNLYVINGISAGSLTLSTALTVPNGGTGASSFSAGQLIVGNGTNSLQTIANSTFNVTGTASSNSTITSLTVDNYGRLTAATYSPISGLTVGQGGTGSSSFTTDGIVYGNGSGPLQSTPAAGTSDQTWSNQILTVTNSGVPTWTTTMDGGSF